MKTRIILLLCAIILASLACSLPTSKPGIITPEASTPSLTPAVTAPATEVAAPATEEASSAMALSQTDACKLLDAANAGKLLGETVNPPTPSNAPGYSACTFFTNTGKGIYITITMGDQAKKNFLNEIAQYQKGCSVGYSGGTSTATPFPPEVEALMSKSVLELFQLDMQMQGKCGGKFEPLPEFGPNAYAYLTPTGFQIGTVAIVSGDNFYSFAYADTGMDIAQMVEKAKEVSRAVFSPTQIEDANPGSDPKQDDVPAPVSSPTWIGPTPDINSPPTLVP